MESTSRQGSLPLGCSSRHAHRQRVVRGAPEQVPGFITRGLPAVRPAYVRGEHHDGLRDPGKRMGAGRFEAVPKKRTTQGVGGPEERRFGLFQSVFGLQLLLFMRLVTDKVVLTDRDGPADPQRPYR